MDTDATGEERRGSSEMFVEIYEWRQETKKRDKKMWRHGWIIVVDGDVEETILSIHFSEERSM